MDIKNRNGATLEGRAQITLPGTTGDDGTYTEPSADSLYTALDGSGVKPSGQYLIVLGIGALIGGYILFGPKKAKRSKSRKKR